MAQQVDHRRRIFRAAGQMQVGHIFRYRCVEIDLALLGELRDHRRRQSFRATRPAEHRLGRHRLARSARGLAIARQEGDPAVFDHADREPGHRRSGHHSLQSRVEQRVIDVVPRRDRQLRQPEVGSGLMRAQRGNRGRPRFRRGQGERSEQRQGAEAHKILTFQNDLPPRALAAASRALNAAFRVTRRSDPRKRRNWQSDVLAPKPPEPCGSCASFCCCC